MSVEERSKTLDRLAQEILAGQLLVETEDHRRLMIDASEVLTVLGRGSAPSTAVADEDDTEH